MYLDLDAAQQAQQALCLELMAGGLDNTARSSLASGSGFIVEVASLLPEMDVRELIAPLVEAALHSNRPVLPEGPISAERETMTAGLQSPINALLVEHVTMASVDGVADAVERLSAAAVRAGVAAETWPRASEIQLLAFCKELSRGPKAGLQQRYAAAEALLQNMDAAEVGASTELDKRTETWQDCSCNAVFFAMQPWTHLFLLLCAREV